MIICNKHKFVFIHVPKCGGTTIRDNLNHFHDDDPIFDTVGRTPHPILGKIAYTHIPLRTLRDYFPDEYKKVFTYRSFAIVREPKSRFISSLSEYLRTTKGIAPTDMTTDKYSAAAEAVCRYLKESGDISDHSFIHFEKQVNYISIDKNKIVTDVFAIEDLKALLAEIEVHTGQENRFIEKPESNVSVVHRSAYSRFLVESLRPIIGGMARAFLSRAALEKLRAGLYVKPRSMQIWDSISLEDRKFLKDYYSDDYKYFHDLRKDAKKEPA